MDKKTNFPADILWVNSTIQKDYYQIKPHTHQTYYHLMYIHSGTCTMIINDKSYDLKSGMIALVNPTDIHSISSEHIVEELHLYELKFIVYSKRLNSAFEHIEKVFYADDVEKVFLELIVKTGYNPEGYINITAARSYLLSFLYYICQEFSENLTLNSASRYLTGIDCSNFSNATIDTVRYIEDNYMHEITLDKIGTAIGYHKNYISAMVKRDLSINVNELLTFIRVQSAAHLLYYSDYSIKQVYQQTGFKGVSHFTRTFKKLTGVTPAQYRKSYPAGTTTDDLKRDDAVPMWGRGLLRDYIEAKAD